MNLLFYVVANFVKVVVIVSFSLQVTFKVSVLASLP